MEFVAIPTGTKGSSVSLCCWLTSPGYSLITRELRETNWDLLVPRKPDKYTIHVSCSPVPKLTASW